jgi:hypothetical protein
MRRLVCSLSTTLVVLLLVACDPDGPTATLSQQPSAPAISVYTPHPSDTPTATLVPNASPVVSTPDEVLQVMDTIEQEMEDLRGLGITTPITRTLITRDELAAKLERDFDEDYPPEEVQADVSVMAAFDFVPKDFDLRHVLLDLYSSEILGLYDEKENTFYIVSDGELDLIDRITVAHETVHGLQDEQFGLDTFVDEDRLNDDQVLARTSLVEGDATLAMSAYLMAHLSEYSPEDLASLQAGNPEGTPDPMMSAPPILRETFDFPYSYGTNFVAILQKQGWNAVDKAFADPPQSTEQILHPEKYFSRDEPTLVSLPPLTDTLGIGWHLVEKETLGEFQTRLYLAQEVDAATADLASQGWDGDQYALYMQGNDQMLIWATVWDSPQDREEFVAAYSRYADEKYGGAATQSSESEYFWEEPVQAAVLSWGDTAAWIVLGPNTPVVQRVLAAVP